MKSTEEANLAVNGIVKEIVSEVEMPHYLEGVQTSEQYKARIESKLHDGFMDYIHTIERGYRTLIEGVQRSGKKIDAFLLTQDKLDKIKDSPLFRKNLQEGKMYQQQMDYTDEQMVELYELALQLFQEHKFSEAADSFFFLATLNPLITSYWIAAACALEQMHRTQEACQIYRIAIMVDPFNLDNWKRAFSCCLLADHVSEKEDLIEMAQKAITTIIDKRDNSLFCDHLKTLLTQVRNETK